MTQKIKPFVMADEEENLDSRTPSGRQRIGNAIDKAMQRRGQQPIAPASSPTFGMGTLYRRQG